MASPTSWTLIGAIRLGDRHAWATVCSLYRPLILYWLKGLRVRHSDLDDLFQVVLIEVIRNVGELDSTRVNATFRGWLRRITENKVRDRHRKWQREVPIHSGVHPDEVMTSIETSDLSMDNEKLILLRQALQLVKSHVEPRTYEAFDLYVLQEKSPAEVALLLDMPINSVYLAKSRVMTKVKSLFEGLL